MSAYSGLGTIKRGKTKNYLCVRLLLSYSLTCVQSEHVVETEISSAWVRGQVENLGKHKWSLTVIDKQFSDNEYNYTIVLGIWLTISTNDLMLDLLEWKCNQFVHNILGSLELFTLKREKRLLAVEWTKGGAISVKRIVVMLNKLTTN